MAPTLEDVMVERPTPGTAVVVFTGEHDLATKDEVTDLLDSLLWEDDLLVADFSSASFVDSSMLGVLLATNEQARELGKTFRLQLGTAAIVQRAFEICGVFAVIERVATREEAIAPEEQQAVAAFAATLVHGPTELRGMRRLLTSWLELTDATAVVQDAVLLATHEAAANAMAHGDRESPVSISASQDEAGRFTVEVINHGPWKEPAAGHHGRGLALMRELMSEVRTKTSVRMLSGQFSPVPPPSKLPLLDPRERGAGLRAGRRDASVPTGLSGVGYYASTRAGDNGEINQDYKENCGG